MHVLENIQYYLLRYLHTYTKKKKKQSMCLENIIIVCMFLYSFSFQLFTQIH